MSYLPYISADRQTVLGHYGVAQTSGAIAATPTALDPHASVRWAPANVNAFFVLLRLRVGFGVISAITTAVRTAYQASIARQFTVDYVTGSTAINLATTAKTNAMRSQTMNNSLMGALGPRITTTGAMSGHTNTLDAAPFAITSWQNLVSTTSTGTAVALQAGSGGPMQTLYERGGDGFHPVVLGQNEGIAVQLVHTGWASGTVSLQCEWTWAEVLAL